MFPLNVPEFAPLNMPRPLTRAPLFEVKKKIYVYECPLCKKRVRFDSDMEPMCTGPNEGLDEHEFVVMEMVGMVDHGRIV